MAKKAAKHLAKEQAKALKKASKAERRKHRRKAQAVLTMAQVADQLRALAAQVEAGTVTLGDKVLELPDQAEFELSYKLKKKGGHEIEVEIEWGGPKRATLLPVE
jgi:amphi-Trp domain-containing protein